MSSLTYERARIYLKNADVLLVRGDVINLTALVNGARGETPPGQSPKMLIFTSHDGAEELSVDPSEINCIKRMRP